MKSVIENGDVFWIVTIPTKVSKLADVLFPTNLSGLEMQFKGGLQASEIVGVYCNYDDASEKANELLSRRAKGQLPTINPNTGKTSWVTIPKD